MLQWSQLITEPSNYRKHKLTLIKLWKETVCHMVQMISCRKFSSLDRTSFSFSFTSRDGSNHCTALSWRIDFRFEFWSSGCVELYYEDIKANQAFTMITEI